jgi:hypothetical protein
MDTSLSMNVLKRAPFTRGVAAIVGDYSYVAKQINCLVSCQLAVYESVFDKIFLGRQNTKIRFTYKKVSTTSTLPPHFANFVSNTNRTMLRFSQRTLMHTKKRSPERYHGCNCCTSYPRWSADSS